MKGVCLTGSKICGNRVITRIYRKKKRPSNFIARQFWLLRDSMQLSANLFTIPKHLAGRELWTA